MKRISFKDSEGLHLTQAVLDGYKTMTRRAVREQVEKGAMVRSSLCSTTDTMRREKFAYILKHSPYEVGDIVAIQQAYRDIPAIVDCRELRKSSGWTNKMFVKAEYMPHHIRITDVSVERLQDISNKDCMREGITRVQPITKNNSVMLPFYMIKKSQPTIASLFIKEVFAKLIDKVCGRGTWDRNPLVWVYNFELVD